VASSRRATTHPLHPRRLAPRTTTPPPPVPGVGTDSSTNRSLLRCSEGWVGGRRGRGRREWGRASHLVTSARDRGPRVGRPAVGRGRCSVRPREADPPDRRGRARQRAGWGRGRRRWRRRPHARSVRPDHVSVRRPWRRPGAAPVSVRRPRSRSSGAGRGGPASAVHRGGAGSSRTPSAGRSRRSLAPSVGPGEPGAHRPGTVDGCGGRCSAGSGALGAGRAHPGKQPDAARAPRVPRRCDGAGRWPRRGHAEHLGAGAGGAPAGCARSTAGRGGTGRRSRGPSRPPGIVAARAACEGARTALRPAAHRRPDPVTGIR